ncbi:MAG: hypothetical protein ACPG7F_12435, partial [Aggregatilineales bacterium]
MTVLDIFTSRELALIIWLAITLVYMLIVKSTRKALINVIEAFLEIRILIPFSVMLIYTGFIVFILKNIGFENRDLVKDSIFWFFGTAIILFINVNDFANGKKSFKKVITENFAFVAILFFVNNSFPHEFWIEFLTIPFAFVIVCLGVVANSDEKYKPVKKLIDYVFIIIAVVTICSITNSILNNLREVASLDTLKNFLAPVILTTTFVPFMYFLSLYLVYGRFFARSNIMLKYDKELTRFIQRRVLLLCDVNLAKILKFEDENFRSLGQIKSKEDVLNQVNGFD